MLNQGIYNTHQLIYVGHQAPTTPISLSLSDNHWQGATFYPELTTKTDTAKIFDQVTPMYPAETEGYTIYYPDHL